MAKAEIHAETPLTALLEDDPRGRGCWGPEDAGRRLDVLIRQDIARGVRAMKQGRSVPSSSNGPSHDDL